MARSQPVTQTNRTKSPSTPPIVNADQDKLEQRRRLSSPHSHSVRRLGRRTGGGTLGRIFLVAHWLGVVVGITLPSSASVPPSKFHYQPRFKRKSRVLRRSDGRWIGHSRPPFVMVPCMRASDCEES